MFVTSAPLDTKDGVYSISINTLDIGDWTLSISITTLDARDRVYSIVVLLFCYPVPHPPSWSCKALRALKDRRLKLTILLLLLLLIIIIILTGTLVCVTRLVLLPLALALAVVTAIIGGRVGARAFVFHALFATAAGQAARALLLHRVFRPTTVHCGGESGECGFIKFRDFAT